MSYIKTKHRASMHGSTLDNQLRLRITGPKDVSELPAYDLSEEWLKTHNIPKGILFFLYNYGI